MQKERRAVPQQKSGSRSVGDLSLTSPRFRFLRATAGLWCWPCRGFFRQGESENRHRRCQSLRVPPSTADCPKWWSMGFCFVHQTAIVVANTTYETWVLPEDSHGSQSHTLPTVQAQLARQPPRLWVLTGGFETARSCHAQDWQTQ